MSVVRAAKKFELVFNFWNIDFQTIFGHTIKHEVNYLFTRTLLMHGFHCREAVQPGCNLSPALTLLPGRTATAHATAVWDGGNPKRTSSRGKTHWARAPGHFIEALPFTSTKMTRVNLHKGGIPSQIGTFWPLLVVMGGSPVRNASHKPEIRSQQKNPFSLIFNCQNLQLLCWAVI